MSGALFVVAITIAVTLIMGAGFLAVAFFDRTNLAARWFALAFAVGTFTSFGEYFIGAGIMVEFWRMVVALSLLAAILLIAYGLSVRTEHERDWAGLAAVFAASSILYYLLLDLPRENFLRQMLYQMPYTLASFFVLFCAMRAPQRRLLDWSLITLLILTALHFLFKPYIAGFVGGVGAEAEDYITTVYALFSQTAGSILSLAIGVTLLLLVAADSASRFMRHAHRDSESGYLNARGFSERLAQHLKEPGDMAIILFSVERSKTEPGTDPIEHIGKAIDATLLPKQVVGRLGEFDFVLFDADANLFAARRQAEILLAALTGARLPTPDHEALVVSIGIAEREAGDGVPDLMARAQWALDEARRAGGNCVRLAARSSLTGARRLRAI